MIEERELELIIAGCSKARKEFGECLTEIKACERRINKLEIQISEKNLQIEEKCAEINENKRLFEYLCNAGREQEVFFEHLNKINEKVEEASSNFSTMVSSTAVKAFDLSICLGEQATNGKSEINGVFQELEDIKASVSRKIDELENEVRKFRSKKEEFEKEIKREYYKISELEARKRRAAFEYEVNDREYNKLIYNQAR